MGVWGSTGSNLFKVSLTECNEFLLFRVNFGNVLRWNHPQSAAEKCAAARIFDTDMQNATLGSGNTCNIFLAAQLFH